MLLYIQSLIILFKHIKSLNLKEIIKQIKMRKIYSFVLALTIGFTAYSQSGILDTSFGQNGFVTTVINGTYNFSNATIVQDDGKILVCGRGGEPSTYKATVARYNTDGSLDNSFANNGTLVIPVGNVKSFATDIALQNDGKIVMSAYTWNDVKGEFAAIRLNSDGSFDSTFGNQGVKLISNQGSGVTQSLRIQDDGKILLAGYYNDEFAVLRLDTDGTIDNSFGVSGWAITTFAGASSFIEEIEIQDDGKIVQGGLVLSTSQIFEMGVARLNTDGTIDQTFGSQGTLRFNIGNGNDFVTGVAIQNNGKIVLGGHTWIDNVELKHDFAMIRLEANGDFDLTYGNNGVSTAQIVDGSNYASGIVIQEDQKVILGGSTVKNADYKFGLLRFNTDGSLDQTFGAAGTGMVSPDFNGRECYGDELNLQPDGDIILVGNSFSNGTSEMIVVRFKNETLGLAENSISNLNIYPNPSSEFITVELNDNSSSFQVEIRDVLGRAVYGATLNQSDKIDVSDFKKGTYFVKVGSNDRSEVIKFVKN